MVSSFLACSNSSNFRGLKKVSLIFYLLLCKPDLHLLFSVLLLCTRTRQTPNVMLCHCVAEVKMKCFLRTRSFLMYIFVPHPSDNFVWRNITCTHHTMPTNTLFLLQAVQSKTGSRCVQIRYFNEHIMARIYVTSNTELFKCQLRVLVIN